MTTKEQNSATQINIDVSCWISVDDKLPDPYNPKLNKPQEYLCYVKRDFTENIFGGMQMILGFGAFEFDDIDEVFKDADEYGIVHRFGWFYERDSEGEYESLMFDMTNLVTHWMPLPEAPNL